MSGFQLKRLGLVMEPEPGNPQEIEGVLNPAAARGPDGELYLFPRLVAKGNYSRIGIARVRFNEAGDPAGVEVSQSLPRRPRHRCPQALSAERLEPQGNQTVHTLCADVRDS